MAVTITADEVAVAIRAAESESTVPAPVAKVLGFLTPAASAIVLGYSPDAPDAIHNMAMIRLCGWLYDADPTDSRISRALEVSGAQGILAAWRNHSIGIVAAEGAAVAPITPAGLPPLPSDGNFILTSDGGVLKWVEFPKP